MRKIIALLFVIAVATSCNNNNKLNTKDKSEVSDDKAGKNDSDSLEENDINKTSRYKWTEKEQNKFLEDCRSEFEGHVEKDKLKDFCACVLTQAQKHYSSYREMDEKGDEELDKQISDNCLEHYNGDEE